MLPDTPVSKDHAAFVVNPDNDAQDEQKRQDEQASANCCSEIKQSLGKAVSLAGKVVADTQHKHLFGVKWFHADVPEREREQIRHEQDITNEWLDSGDQLSQAFALQPRCRDDDRIDAGTADDGLGVCQRAHQLELLRQRLGDRVVIEDADDLVAVPEIPVEKVKDLFRCLSCTDQDDGLCQRMRCFQEL